MFCSGLRSGLVGQDCQPSIRGEVLTACGNTLFSVVQHSAFVNMPVFTPTMTSSLPETCCFLRPKFTLLEGEGGREGLKEEQTKMHFFIRGAGGGTASTEHSARL